MTGKNGKKEVLIILLAGLCLNLSSFHLHSLNDTPAHSDKNEPSYIGEELPFCFACKHLNYGWVSVVEMHTATIRYHKAPQLDRRKAVSDDPRIPHCNKSPPSPLPDSFSNTLFI